MLELDRAVRPANLGHKSLAMPGFNVLLPGKIRCEHGLVIGDDYFEFVIQPMLPNLRFVNHLVAAVEIAKRLPHQEKRVRMNVLRVAIRKCFTLPSVSRTLTKSYPKLPASNITKRS